MDLFQIISVGILSQKFYENCVGELFLSKLVEICLNFIVEHFLVYFVMLLTLVLVLVLAAFFRRKHSSHEETICTLYLSIYFECSCSCLAVFIVIVGPQKKSSEQNSKESTTETQTTLGGGVK